MNNNAIRRRPQRSAPVILHLAGFCLLALCAGPVVATRVIAEEASSAFRTTPPKEHRLKVTSNRHAYKIRLGGTVDMDNTLTRHHATFHVAFQPNVSLTIENTGDTPVVNPRVVTNGKRRWWSMRKLLEEILAGAKDDQERALLIWDFVRKNRHHDDPIFVNDELHDPMKMLNVFGGGLCDDAGAVGCSLLYNAGFNEGKFGRNPKVRHLHGHVMCEVFLAGAYQFLDMDEDAFYLDRENERPVSGDALARDHDLVKREHAYGPIFQGWDVGEKAAPLFGTDDGAGLRVTSGHQIDITLRPDEKLVFRWDNVGKFASDGPRGRRFWGNSLHTYSPRLDEKQYRQGASAHKDVHAVTGDAQRSRLAGATKDAFLAYEMRSPYAVCGGRVRADFRGAHASDRFEVSLSLDRKSWKSVWSHSGKGAIQARVDLDEQLQVKQRPAKYRYWVRVALGSAAPDSAQLTALTMETDLMTSPHSLPRLSLRDNQVEYTDETDEPHEVTLTHRWRESGNVIPPRPPEKPLFPQPDSIVRASTFQFQWPKVAEATKYHILVSRTPDMKLCYRTCFDTVIEGTSHGSPFTGMFSPDVDYYWRVRPQNAHGVWGEWSDMWRFRWDGPRVPVDLKYDLQKNGEMTITWKPNPRGPRPVAYEVFGSDERGFSISRKPHQVRGLGEQASNLLGRTTQTQMRVVSAATKDPNMNRSFYRVVAVDEHGSESGCSDYVELPHPHVVSRPVTRALVDQPYRYQLKTLRSIGDLQHRYTSPNQTYWEKEDYGYELLEGPAWLKLDGETGLLTGTPGRADVGDGDVKIVVKRRFPNEVKPTDQSGRVFQKTDARFQSSHEHRFRIQVGPG